MKISEKKKKLVNDLNLLSVKYSDDIESLHIEADKLLLNFINSKEVTQAFCNLSRWYS